VIGGSSAAIRAQVIARNNPHRFTALFKTESVVRQDALKTMPL
jgi:hypothetical protein